MPELKHYPLLGESSSQLCVRRFRSRLWFYHHISHEYFFHLLTTQDSGLVNVSGAEPLDNIKLSQPIEE